MFTKTITFTDFNGVQRTEKHYFNLSKSELVKLEGGVAGGFTEMIQKMIEAKDNPALMDLFQTVILKAYGVKSADGRRFEKSDELSREFSQTGAYDELYMEMMTNPEKAAEFMNGIIPQDLAEQVKNQPLNLMSAE